MILVKIRANDYDSQSGDYFLAFGGFERRTMQSKHPNILIRSPRSWEEYTVFNFPIEQHSAKLQLSANFLQQPDN